MDSLNNGFMGNIDSKYPKDKIKSPKIPKSKHYCRTVFIIQNY